MLVVTLGDPHSVNIELLLRALAPQAASPASPWRPGAPWPTLLVGSLWQWRHQTARLGLPHPPVTVVAEPAAAPAGALALLDIGTEADAHPPETLDERARGALARRTLESVAGVGLATAGRRLAVVTAPIDKHACHEAGFAFPGQTEFFEHLWGGSAVMTLAGPRLKVGLVTNHLALREVPGALTRELIEAKLTLFVRTLREVYGLAAPRVAVCGLNPHASDQGLFGDEEARLVAPAVAAVQRREASCRIQGPLPADTVFYRNLTGDFDGVLAMYHDQGLGPLKTVHFDEAVNLSGGLAHLRVSPDHGPARDLYLAHKASPKSLVTALALASRYLEGSGPAQRDEEGVGVP